MKFVLRKHGYYSYGDHYIETDDWECIISEEDGHTGFGKGSSRAMAVNQAIEGFTNYLRDWTYKELDKEIYLIGLRKEQK